MASATKKNCYPKSKPVTLSRNSVVSASTAVQVDVSTNKKKSSCVSSKCTAVNEAACYAAKAAVSRALSQKKQNTFKASLAIKARIRKELDDGKQKVSKPARIEIEMSPHLAAIGVYFRCPLISDEVLTKDEWKVKIKEFLFNTLEEERGMTACLILYSCNYNRTKVTDCVNILCRYLDNLIANPEEPKFHKIRCSNATFNDKVLPILGALDFLYAAGFRQQKLDVNGTEEDFWVWAPENIDGMDTLQLLRDTLKSEERVELEIDRNIQVLSPAQAAQRIELPQDFYAISAEELKREKQLRSEMVEKQMQLRTKAMREKDEIREIRKYKFCLIRVRFPDGLYLQGTFSVYEKFSEVMDFVRENLEHEGLPFILSSPTGHRFEDSDKDSTLADLRLVPASILMFQWDPSFEEDLKLAGNITYLKPEMMMLVQSM